MTPCCVTGQATDSPHAGPVTSMGFPSAAEDPSPCLYRIPIVGYEVLEERARFTVRPTHGAPASSLYLD